MSGRWWRAYDEAVDDPKLQQLRPDLFRAWFNICCITSQNGGVLSSINAIAFKLRVSYAKADSIVQQLMDAGLIDALDNGNLCPHNWDGRQFKSDVTDPTNATRQKNYRNRHRNGPDTVTPTVTITPTRDRADTEKKDAANAAPIDPDADLFRRGKQVLGADAGSLIAKLKKKKGSVSQARAVIEQASEKQNPREYVGRVINGPAAATTESGERFPEGII